MAARSAPCWPRSSPSTIFVPRPSTAARGCESARRIPCSRLGQRRAAIRECDSCGLEQSRRKPTRLRRDDRLLRRAPMGERLWLRLRPIASVAELSEAADRVVEHDGRSGLDGSLRLPSAHWRAQGRARFARNRPRGRSRSSRRPAKRRVRVLAELAAGNARGTNSASASRTSFAPPERAPKRCSAILNRRLASDARGRVARGRGAAAADHADSSGKVADRMSGITTHVLDAVLGKPAAGVACAWKSGKTTGDNWIPRSESVTDADGRCRDLAKMPLPAFTGSLSDTGAYLERRAEPASIRRSPSLSSATARRIITCRCC
jgi:hypothetical protein